MRPIRCYVLTAPGHNPARMENAKRQLDAAGIGFIYVEGLLPGDPEIDRSYSAWRNLFFNKRSLSRSEIAAYLGHRRIWETIIHDQAEVALVFEDDFQFRESDDNLKALSAARDVAQNWDIVKLFDFKSQIPKASFHQSGQQFAVNERPNSGLVGYFIGKACCERLLQQRHIFRPVDEELRYWFAHRISICSITPNLVSDVSKDLGGSMIEPDRQAVKRRRNVLRSIWGNFITLYINLRCQIWSRHIVGRVDRADVAAGDK